MDSDGNNEDWFAEDGFYYYINVDGRNKWYEEYDYGSYGEWYDAAGNSGEWSIDSESGDYYYEENYNNV
jgi:hypothetical protein